MDIIPLGAEHVIRLLYSLIAEEEEEELLERTTKKNSLEDIQQVTLFSLLYGFKRLKSEVFCDI